MNAQTKTKDMGAPADAGQALVATPSSPQAVSTKGFDPSRGKLALMLARAMGNDLRNEIARIVCAADMGTGRDGLLGRHYLAADLIFEAIARDATTGATAEGDSAPPNHHLETSNAAG